MTDHTPAPQLEMEAFEALARKIEQENSLTDGGPHWCDGEEPMANRDHFASMVREFATGLAQSPQQQWLPPEEAGRPDGFECAAIIPVRWQRAFHDRSAFEWVIAADQWLTLDSTIAGWAPSIANASASERRRADQQEETYRAGFVDGEKHAAEALEVERARSFAPAPHRLHDVPCLINPEPESPLIHEMLSPSQPVERDDRRAEVERLQRQLERAQYDVQDYRRQVRVARQQLRDALAEVRELRRLKMPATKPGRAFAFLKVVRQALEGRRG